MTSSDEIETDAPSASTSTDPSGLNVQVSTFNVSAFAAMSAVLNAALIAAMAAICGPEPSSSSEAPELPPELAPEEPEPDDPARLAPAGAPGCIVAPMLLPKAMARPHSR
jgi:hypothetical protein